MVGGIDELAGRKKSTVFVGPDRWRADRSSPNFIPPAHCRQVTFGGEMISAAKAVIWTNHEKREVRVSEVNSGIVRSPGWGDPIGAHYAQWQKIDNRARVQLMLETAIDLAMQGYDLGTVLKAFADVQEFRTLCSESYPMCRALTKAIVGQSLEPNTMTFEELLVAYRPK
jgi:hypothetical protein